MSIKTTEKPSGSDNLNSLVGELKAMATRSHYYCEDSWYSCPKAEDGCCNDAMGDDCSCGADEHNAKVEELVGNILGKLPNVTGEPSRKKA